LGKELTPFFAVDDRGDFRGGTTLLDGFFVKVFAGPLDDCALLPASESALMGEAAVEGFASPDGVGVGKLLDGLGLGLWALPTASPRFS
jgi:hypothetical protein